MKQMALALLSKDTPPKREKKWEKKRKTLVLNVKRSDLERGQERTGPVSAPGGAAAAAAGAGGAAGTRAAVQGAGG